jgi:hypothetical protein
MKAIYGKMNMRLDYEFVELIEAPNCCDNCNKPISIIMVLKDKKNKMYNVGTDCGKAIIEATQKYYGYFEGYRDFLEAQKELRRTKKFDLFLRKHLVKTIIKTKKTNEGLGYVKYLLVDRDGIAQYYFDEDHFLKLSNAHQALILIKKH